LRGELAEFGQRVPPGHAREPVDEAAHPRVGLDEESEPAAAAQQSRQFDRKSVVDGPLQRPTGHHRADLLLGASEHLAQVGEDRRRALQDLEPGGAIVHRARQGRQRLGELGRERLVLGEERRPLPQRAVEQRARRDGGVSTGPLGRHLDDAAGPERVEHPVAEHAVDPRLVSELRRSRPALPEQREIEPRLPVGEPKPDDGRDDLLELHASPVRRTG